MAGSDHSGSTETTTTNKSGKTGTTGTTEKSAKDAFHLERDLKKTQSNAKGKPQAAQRPSSAAGPSNSGMTLGEVGDHCKSLRFVTSDKTTWPANSEVVQQAGVMMLRDKTTKKLLRIIKPEVVKEKTTKSIRAFLIRQVQRFKGQ
jgi:hypothetical protein